MASNEEIKNEQMRNFATGATRNLDVEREDPEGFFSPASLESYIAYMHKNRLQKNGQLRASDNWQLGIPQMAYMKSLWRHFFTTWKLHRELGNHKQEPCPYRNPQMVENLNAMIFNCLGYLTEELKKPERPAIRGAFFADDVISENQRKAVEQLTRTTVYGKVSSPMMLPIDASGYGHGV